MDMIEINTEGMVPGEFCDILAIFFKTIETLESNGSKFEINDSSL